MRFNSERCRALSECLALNEVVKKSIFNLTACSLKNKRKADINFFRFSCFAKQKKRTFASVLKKMKLLKEYTIAISGLKEGVHHFDFEVKDEFFALFEASPIKRGDVKVDFYFEKQSGMYVLIFAIDGKVGVECDRCLEEFMLPISSSDTLFGKFDPSEAEDDPDIIYIPKTDTEINIAEYIYEFIVLSVPLSKTHDDAGERCPEEIYKYLAQEPEPETDEPAKNNPFGDALKGFNSN